MVGQSGGPTAVINQSLVGVIEACVASPVITGVLGAMHGFQGVLDEDLVDLARERPETLEAVAATPAAALGSVRMKPNREQCHRALEVLRAHDVCYFFYIGGNDSAETVRILKEVAVEGDYDLRLFHVPKTIDNDLLVTDHCPGYGSAARFVAAALMGDDFDNRSLGGVKIDVIMGRQAGWLTAASRLARVREGDGPHLIYVPERDFDLDAFVTGVDRTLSAHGRCLVAVSEGVRSADGEPLVTSGEVDAFGHKQLSGSGALGDFLAQHVKSALGASLRVRADTFGYLQRSFAGFASEVDQREARAVGRVAVEIATGGETTHGSIVILREPGPEYRVRYEATALEDVAAGERRVSDVFLSGNDDIAPAFLDYVRPLVGELPVTARLAGHRLARKRS